MEDDKKQAANESVPAKEEEYHLSFIAAICVRPKMYTMDGTLAEAAAFIEGYRSGMARGSDPTGSARRVSEQWQRFFRWAGQKIGTSEFCNDRLFFETLRQQCPDEAKAFQMVADFCEEYHKTQEPFLW